MNTIIAHRATLTIGSKIYIRESTTSSDAMKQAIQAARVDIDLMPNSGKYTLITCPVYADGKTGMEQWAALQEMCDK